LTEATAAAGRSHARRGGRGAKMSAPTVAAELEEPIGIIISSGKRAEPTPAFTAYEWGPASEEPEPAQKSVGT
jgi:hypothetical protein